MAKSKKTVLGVDPNVVIGTPESGDTNDQNPLMVAGNLPNADEGVPVTIHFTKVGTGGGPAPADQTAYTSDTSCWDANFDDVNPGTYNITASAAGYSPTTVTGIIVPANRFLSGGAPEARIAMEPAAHSFDVFLTLRDTISVDDAIYAVVILEHEHPKRFFDILVDHDVEGRTGWRVRFAFVPKGRYFRRSIVYRRSGPAVRESTLITVR